MYEYRWDKIRGCYTAMLEDEGITTVDLRCSDCNVDITEPEALNNMLCSECARSN